MKLWPVSAKEFLISRSMPVFKCCAFMFKRYNESGLISQFLQSCAIPIPLVDMKANNYEVVEAGEVITFRGLVQKSSSQAFFLVFCTLLGMASLALVLQIQFQDLGEL